GTHYVGMYDDEGIYYDFGSNLPQGIYKLTLWVKGCPASFLGSEDRWGVQVLGGNSVLSDGDDAYCAIVGSRSTIGSYSWTASNWESWRQVEFLINTEESNLRYLTITPLRTGRCDNYIYIDNVSMENYCCGDYMLYQNTNNLPPLTQRRDFIWAGYDVGAPWTTPGDVVVQSDQHVTLEAAAPQLFPGVDVQPGGVLELIPGGCEYQSPQTNYEIDYRGNNNIVHFTCDNDLDYSLSFASFNATYYRARIFDRLGELVLDKWGFIHSIVTVYTDGSDMWAGTCNLGGEYVVELELFNCETGAYTLKLFSVYFEYETNSPCYPLDYCSCPEADCPGKKGGDIAMKDDEAPECSIYPNPANQEVNISLKLTEGSNCSFVLHDAIGRNILAQTQNFSTFGSYIYTLPVSGISPGIYFLDVRINQKSTIFKLVITR
ncbi:MAG TPA: T9SS type A sorting domain-containing protein, partial [Chitinophagales bacterium]|nr:T9SS type A sorting domain-containing protein [Chitinophagales bacterium]